jgi:NADH dehydrogenase FAD-containing subunit
LTNVVHDVAAPQSTRSSVPHLADVYVIGDTALANCWKGQPVPGLAPAAKQGGAFVAKVIRAKLAPALRTHIAKLAFTLPVFSNVPFASTVRGGILLILPA